MLANRLASMWQRHLERFEAWQGWSKIGFGQGGVVGSNDGDGLHARFRGRDQFGGDIGQKKDLARCELALIGDATVARHLLLIARGGVVVGSEQRSEIPLGGVTKEQLLGEDTARGIDAEVDAGSLPSSEGWHDVRKEFGP